MITEKWQVSCSRKIITKLQTSYSVRQECSDQGTWFRQFLLASIYYGQDSRCVLPIFRQSGLVQFPFIFSRALRVCMPLRYVCPQLVMLLASHLQSIAAIFPMTPLLYHVPLHRHELDWYHQAMDHHRFSTQNCNPWYWYQVKYSRNLYLDPKLV